jgi:hypothetical protein
MDRLRNPERLYKGVISLSPIHSAYFQDTAW